LEKTNKNYNEFTNMSWSCSLHQTRDLTHCESRLTDVKMMQQSKLHIYRLLNNVITFVDLMSLLKSCSSCH